MASFQDLQWDILGAVSERLSIKHLAAFSRTSKFVRSAAEPVLYREISFQWNKTENKHAPVHLLLRCVASRPELALLIKRLEFRGEKPFDWWKNRPSGFYRLPQTPSRSVWISVSDPDPDSDHDPDHDLDHKPDFTSTEMAVTKQLIRSLQLPVASAERNWLRGLRRGQVDVFIALLLSQTFNLHHLRLDFDFQRETSFLQSLINHPALGSQKPHFAALTHVKLSPDVLDAEFMFSGPFDLGRNMPLFSLPSIKSIGMPFPPRNMAWQNDSPSQSSITSLTLYQTQLFKGTLGPLLRTTPSLRSLRFHVLYATGSLIYKQFGKLSQPLAWVKESLEHLVVSVEFTSLHLLYIQHSPAHVLERLAWLKDFKQLRSLEIPMITLGGWTAKPSEKLDDFLPPMLNHLSLTDHFISGEIDDWSDTTFWHLMKGFVEEKKSGALELKSISLTFDFLFIDCNRESLDELKNMCECAGMKCDILTQD